MTYLPSRPASGEVLTWKFMARVGSSTLDRRQPFGLLRIADRQADIDLLDAGDGDDVAGGRLIDRFRAAGP